MARPKPWLKMWIEWLHDPKMLGLTLAEQGAWWRLVTLAQQCKADGQLVKDNGSPLSLPEIANSLHISTRRDMKVLQSMIDKMEAADSLRWSSHVLTIVHFAERQAKTSSETPEAIRDRVRRHRESRDVTEIPLQEEIREALLNLPTYSSYIAEHEAVKGTLHELGLKKGYISRAEVTIPSGRVDLIWANKQGENIAAFEIDARLPKWKSIVKLRALSCAQSFIILRAGTTPFSQEGNITLIGLGRPRLKELKNDAQEYIPTPPQYIKEGEVEVEGKSVTFPLHLEKSEAILAEIVTKYEQNFGIITPVLGEKFKDFVENYRGPVEWIKEAFAEAVTHNVRKWAYVEAILDRWQQEGREKHGRGISPGRGAPAHKQDPHAAAKAAGWKVGGEEEKDGTRDQA